MTTSFIENLGLAAQRQDWFTFEQLLEEVDPKNAVAAADMAYQQGRMEAFRRVVVVHPQRNYSVLLKHLLEKRDYDNAAWLLDHTSHTTIRHIPAGDWTAYPDLHMALVEREIRTLPPTVVLHKAATYQRMDFVDRAIEAIQPFPHQPNRPFTEREKSFIEALLGFVEHEELLKRLMGETPSPSTVHQVAVLLASCFDHNVSLRGVLALYTPTEPQRQELVGALLEHLREASGGYSTISSLMTYYDPLVDGERVLEEALWFKNKDVFTQALDKFSWTSLDKAHQILKQTVDQESKRGLKPPTHWGLFVQRVEEERLRQVLLAQLGSPQTTAASKFRKI